MYETITQFDFSILDFIYQNIRCDFLDPVMAAFSFFASKGIGWIILALVLMIPKRTRRAGVLALGSMIVGLILVNLTVKNIVARPRPYELYQAFHNQTMPFTLNAGIEHDTSFPSGHTCCSFASAAVYFYEDKKLGCIALLGALLIGFSRLYNYVHFPTDVLGGMLFGILSSVIAVIIYRQLNKKFSLDERLIKSSR